MNATSIHEDLGSIPGDSFSGLRIQCCYELWCRLQTRLGSQVAVAVVWAVVLIQPLAWKLPYAADVALKKKKDKTKKIFLFTATFSAYGCCKIELG